MINSLIFNFKRCSRLLNQNYLSFIQYLQYYYKLIIVNLLKYQTSFILYPSTLFFILSYPSLYSLLISQNYSLINDNNNYIKLIDINGIGIDSYNNDKNYKVDFQFKYYWIQPNLNNFDSRLSLDLVDDTFNSQVMDKSYLIDLLNFQNVLLEDLDLDSIYLNSPFNYWNNNLVELQNDKNILKTIHSKSHLNNNYNVFNNLVKIDGLIKNSNSFQVCIIYKPNEQIDNKLYENLSKIKESQKGKFLVIDEINPRGSNKDELYKVNYRYSNSIEKLLIKILPILLFIYITISLTNIHSIKSRVGLMIAFVVEISLSIFSSISIILFFNNELLIFQIPIQIVLMLIFLITIENMFRLLNSISKTSDELSLSIRLLNSLVKTGPVSLILIITTCIILLLVSLIFNNDLTKQYCLFIGLTLIFDHLLHLSYFLTILSIDIRRLELEDLLQRSNNNKKQVITTKSIKPLGNGSILSLTIFNKLSLSHNNKISYKRFFGQILLKIKLPLFKSIRNSMFVVIICLFFALKWTNGLHIIDTIHYQKNQILVNNFIITIFNYSNFNFFKNKYNFVDQLLNLYSKFNGFENTKNEFIFSISDPIIITNFNSLKKNSLITFDLNTIYKFDLYYFCEFLSCLMFVLSSASIALKFSLDKESLSSSLTDSTKIDTSTLITSDTESEFNSKDLVNAHFLDIVKIATSSCPFVVSVGMDHKVLVWSPMANPLPNATQLPISSKLLPITNVVMSPSGSLITIFSKSGVVKCWSRLSMSWIWTIQIFELVNSGVPMESFFRTKASTNNNSRKKMSSKLTTKKSKLSKEVSIDEETGSAASTPPPPTTGTTSAATPAVTKTTTTRKLKSRGRTTLNSGPSLLTRSLSIDSTYDRSTNLKQLSLNNSNKEFIIVLKSGEVVIVSCEDGSVEKFQLTNLKIVAIQKLISPRVNDRLVCILADGSLIVSTIVNNKWKVRNVKVQKNSYNSGKSLITPAIISRTSSMNMKSIEELQKFRTHLKQNSQVTLTNSNYIEDSPRLTHNEPEHEQIDYSDAVMITMPFVGMIIRAINLKVELIDVQTGTLVKTFFIGQFKPNSLKIFYPEPSHCKFCGCASISSFSIVYNELDSDLLILHTFSIDNKAKNSICLRVERDPRETRCLGFDSVSEHQHWLNNVEGWCATDLNMLMGLRRKEKEDVINVSDKATAYSSAFNLLSKNGTDRSCSSLNNYKKLKKSNAFIESYPKLNDIWEGWTMSSTGEIKYFKLPNDESNNSNSRNLLIKKLGPITKFGHKSIVVSFGNIMKILYLGNDKLIEDENELNGAGNLSSSGKADSNDNNLSFINRHRKMKLMKYELTHSTNFNDNVDPNADNEV